MANIPLYQMIYNHFYEKIRSGEYKAGDQLPTEAEISEYFRVSRITAKRAMNLLADNQLIERIPGRGSFVMGSAETQEVPYTVHSRKDNVVGVVLCDIGPSFGMDVLKGIEHKAKELGYHIIFKRSLDNRKEENQVIRDLLAFGVAGIIIQLVHGETYSPLILKEYYNGFPFVFVDRHMDKTTIPFVASNNYQAVFDTTKLLLQKGYDHIAFMSADVHVTSTLEQRFSGFQDALITSGKVYSKDLNLLTLKDPELSEKKDDIKEQDIESIYHHLKNHPEIDCVFAAEFVVASMVQEAARRLGKRIPEDLGIVCFDAEPAFEEMRIFTYLKQQQFEMGAKAVELLHEQIEKGLHKEEYKVILDVELVQGRSTKTLKE